jgi:hypothetical protein
MKFIHYEFDLGLNDAVEVSLDKQANVLLLDGNNFQRYRNRQQYTYHGGRAIASPVRLRPPHPGRWHVVVDTGGNAGTVRASVRVI